jgi:hypothetical protein
VSYGPDTLRMSGGINDKLARPSQSKPWNHLLNR